MRIDRVEIFQVCIPFKKPFQFGHTVQENRDHVVVAIHSDGKIGWGEGGLLRWPFYNSETTAGAFQLLRDVLAPLVVGRTVTKPSDLVDIFAAVVGNKITQAAVDFALWDLFSQNAGASLSRYLGGSRWSIPIGISVGLRASEQEFLDVVDSSIARGFTRVKCKITPGFPVEVLRAVRNKYPDLVLSVDANGTFGERDFNQLQAYDTLSLAMIEQPFHPKQMLLSAELQRAIKTSICLDEGIEDIEDVKLAGALKACRVVNIKPARVGGLTSSIAIRDLSRTIGLATWVGGLMETGIGRAVNLAFASTVSEDFPHDIAECGRYCREELVSEVFNLNPGARLEIPSNSPGIGVTVRREALLQYSVAHTTVEC